MNRERNAGRSALYLGLAFRFGSSRFSSSQSAPERATDARQQDNHNRIY